MSHNARILRTPRQLHAFEHYIASCPPALRERYITALAIIPDDNPFGLWTQLLLERLSGLRHLAISGIVDLPVSSLTRLRNLDILCRNDLWSQVSGEVRAYSSLGSPSLGSITHLRVGQLTHLLGVLLTEESALPALTHFAFATIPAGSHVHAHAHLLHVCKLILGSSARAKMVLMVACGRIGGRILRSDISLTTIADPRFIVWGEDETEDDMLGDWRVRALGGLDFFGRFANGVVATYKILDEGAPLFQFVLSPET
ncbi:hypothetical protein AURDEDRAFT_171675 [Auricularia subglabra TFB-10046 SS5]|nr:hypothetical protein AURDEDRAFT_171675 [Auricularia subglabra TFB-10046 SS5]